MRKRLLPALTALVLAVGVCLLAGFAIAHAQNVSSGDNLSVPASRTIDGTYIAGGRSIDIGGTVNGDVICGTQTLTIGGTVHGDVICGAQSITITGHVDGDVRLAGQSITLSGAVGHNASVVGQDLILSSGARIGGDLSYAGSSLTADGSIGRDLLAAGQTATIAGTVGRNVDATIDRLTLTSNANVTGRVHYTSRNEANVANGAHVGSLQQSQPTAKQEQARGVSRRWFGLLVLWYVLAALFCTLILALIMPLFFWRLSDEAAARPGWTILTGFITAVVLPALIVLCFVSVIGIPLGILLLFAELMLILLSFPVSAFYLGRLLFTTWLGWSQNAIVVMLLGVIVLLILLAIPFLDILVWFLMVWVGFGSMARGFRHYLVRPDYRLPAGK